MKKWVANKQNKNCPKFKPRENNPDYLYKCFNCNRTFETEYSISRCKRCGSIRIKKKDVPNIKEFRKWLEEGNGREHHFSRQSIRSILAMLRTGDFSKISNSSITEYRKALKTWFSYLDDVYDTGIMDNWGESKTVSIDVEFPKSNKEKTVKTKGGESV